MHWLWTAAGRDLHAQSDARPYHYLTLSPASIPDLGIGRFGSDRYLWIQGGAEQKKAVQAMQDLPDVEVLRTDAQFRVEMNKAILQGMDQVKAAIKNGAVPSDIVIKWIIAVGPYFIIQPYGPFGEGDLISRGHCPNSSGEDSIMEKLKALSERAKDRSVEGAIYRIGTIETAVALHNYIGDCESFYDPDCPRYPRN